MNNQNDPAYRSKYVVSVGTLEEADLADNMLGWLWKRGFEFRLPDSDESLDDYVDYLFLRMEQLTPRGRYFGTPDDKRNNFFGFFPLPDTRKP